MFLLYKKKNKIQLGLILMAVVWLSPSVYGQRIIENNTRLSWKDRLYFGGGIDLSGESSYFRIGLNPIAGYMITPKLSAGVGVLWQYLLFYNQKNLSVSQYGGHIFARYNFANLPMKNSLLFIYGEYGFLNGPIALFEGAERRTVSRLPLGLGYTQRLGSRGAINGMVLYDILFSQTSGRGGYYSPWIFRIFFTV